MAKKILFVTTMNLSTNPRILKEIKLANLLNYQITFLGFRLGNWSDSLDEEIQKRSNGPIYIYKDATRKKFYQWLKYSLLERFNRVIWKLDKNNLFLTSTASNKRVFSLLDYGKHVGFGDYDFVIGHTLGSFYPAMIIANQANCPFALDMEDYHPGEYIEGDKKDEVTRREIILKYILPKANYVSASSPLIAHFTKKLCDLNDEKVFTILNYFPASEFKTPRINSSGKIKLIWFSQVISAGRGLEILVSVWDKIRGNFELTIIGSPDETFNLNFRDGIKIINPLSQAELHEELGKHDIGLALDLTSRDFNRDIALTNKILAYYQAGLFILATDTSAQKDFIHNHPGSGKLFSQNNSASFIHAMREINENIEQIRSDSFSRYQEGTMHSWDNESNKLKEIWYQQLN